MGSGYFIRKTGVFILWLISGFKGSFREAEEKHYRYDFIVGFVFVGVIGFLIFMLF